MKGGLRLRALLLLAFGWVAMHSSLAAPAARPPAHRPADFGFRIEDGWGNCVDSDSGRVTKDLVRGPDTTIAIRFRPAEMDTIYRAFVGLDVFGLPEPHPDFNWPRGQLTTAAPNTWHRFEIRGHDVQKSFAWSDGERNPFRMTAGSERFFMAIHVVEQMVSRRPEYARLPGPRAQRH